MRACVCTRDREQGEAGHRVLSRYGQPTTAAAPFSAAIASHNLTTAAYFATLMTTQIWPIRKEEMPSTEGGNAMPAAL